MQRQKKKLTENEDKLSGSGRERKSERESPTVCEQCCEWKVVAKIEQTEKIKKGATVNVVRESFSLKTIENRVFRNTSLQTVSIKDTQYQTYSI